MQQKIIIFIICFIYANITFAQQRKTIDRSKQTVSQKSSASSSITKKNNSSSSNSSKREKSSSNQRKNSTFYFSISSTNVEFSETGGLKTFTISASNSWTISTNTASWGI